MCVDGAPALNRVRWAHSGKEIATGDSEGQVQVYDIGEVRCRRTGYCDVLVIFLKDLLSLTFTADSCQHAILLLSAANLHAQG